MSSHIDCDDLLALAASCSVEEQLNADLRNQLSMSLLCHIAQASASHPHGGATSSYAPATTPTTANSFSNPSNAWISDESFYNTHHQSRRRESSLARAHSRYHTIEENQTMEDSDGMMQMEQDDVPINAFSQHNGEYGRLSGKHSESTETASLFATSDPFYLAVQELQAASQCRRQLQPKLFSVNAPLQVTPNPMQFGTLNTGSAFGQHHHFGSASNANGYERRGPTAMPMDASLMQYR